MPLPLTDILMALPLFALVLLRIAGLVLTAPLFGTPIAPVRVRAAFAMTLALVVFPVVAAQVPGRLDLSDLLQAAFAELVVGMTIGLGLSTLLVGAQVAGTVAGQQAGMALGEVFNPFQNEDTAILAQVYVAILMLVFLAVGGHRATLTALLDTYHSIPILSYTPGESIVVLLITSLTTAFVFGLRMAGPVVIALFLTEAAFGFLSRTVPQLNILSVGFGLRNLIALGVAAISLAALEPLLTDAIRDGIEAVRLWSQSS
jgi:flagellar biosynthetic protein FliR